MKKIIYAGVCLALIGTTILVACNKEARTTDTRQTPTVNPDSKTILSDADLIDIINGLDPGYTKIEEVEEVLFDNCRLSSSVLRTLIDESKYPDYIVEEMMILSAPVSSTDLTYLHSVRPSLSTTTIVAAGSVDIANSEFSVSNLNPRHIYIAKGLTRKSLCEDGCGESEFKGTDFVTLHLTSTTTPLDPAEIADCDQGKWVCGKTVEERIVLNEGATTIVVVKCEGTTEKCVRKVSKTK